MKREQFADPTILALGYDADRHVLEVELQDGSVTRYFMVPRSVFEAFLTASSKARFLNTKIEGVYACERI
jgi:hypothetical protein